MKVDMAVETKQLVLPMSFHPAVRVPVSASPPVAPGPASSQTATTAAATTPVLEYTLTPAKALLFFAPIALIRLPY